MTTYNPNNPIWIDYAIQIVPVGQRLAANAHSSQHGNYFASDTDEFSWDSARELTKSENGAPPTSALLIGGLIRQSQKDAFVNFGSDINGGKVYLESAGWTIETALSDADLYFIPDDEDLI